MPWYQTLQIFVLTMVAALGVPAVIAKYSERARLEGKLKRLLDIVEKFPEDAIGRAQLNNDIKTTALKLAFRVQYPRTFRSFVPALVIVAVFAAAGSSIFWAGDKPVIAWIAMGVEALGIVTYRAVFYNVAWTDRLVRALFVELHGPVGLTYPPPPIFRRREIPGVGDVMRYAADARDRAHDIDGSAMTTTEAVNVGLLAATDDLRALDAEYNRLRLKLRWAQLQRPFLRLRFEVIIYLGKRRAQKTFREAIRIRPDLEQELRESYADLLEGPRLPSWTAWTKRS